MPGTQGAGERGGQRCRLHGHQAQCLPGHKPRTWDHILVGTLARPPEAENVSVVGEDIVGTAPKGPLNSDHWVCLSSAGCVPPNN